MSEVPVHSLPLPPESLRERVAGTADAQWFHDSGSRTVAEWARALHCSNMSLSSAGVVLDFGCGCGRVVRHLRPALSADQVLIAGDVDREAVAWVRDNIKGVDAVVLPQHPPSSFPDAAVDLIVSQSVFTHLPEDVQFAWLTELRRILRPGGVLLTSIHGPKVAREYYRSLVGLSRFDEAEHFIRCYHRDDFYYTQGRTVAERELPEYYGATFHHLRYVQERWCDGFGLFGYFPVASLGHQDIVVLGKL